MVSPAVASLSAVCALAAAAPYSWTEDSSTPWNFWESGHPDPTVRERQQLEWKEFTLAGGSAASPTGLTSGLLRLAPYKELPRHYHPDPFGETYFFTRGNGFVSLGEGEEVAIEARRHVNIPARTMHGLRTGSEGAEFVWTFPARRWSDVAYYFEDPSLQTLNDPGEQQQRRAEEL
mmetsp:Transcript_116392/g.340505  ORF Transcript_116392/g.340505 Transcript_116392/m.340505 type:complete len:176 (-) Transcript_116392:42-569(-)